MNTSTITSYLFKVLPFGLLFTVYTCTEGLPVEEVGETANGSVLTTLDATLALEELWGLTSAKSQSDALIPNNIDTSRNARKISRQGQKTSYTFALAAAAAKSQSSGYVAENLVVELNADSTMSAYIFRYAPDMAWYGDPDSALDTYTGNIEFSDVSGGLFSQAYFEGGVPVDGGEDMAKSTDGCDLDAYLICTELMHDDGSSYGESCDFIVTAYCPNPGGGPQGNPGGWDDEDETDVIGGGGSGEDEDDDTVETTPLLDPCHITDSCEDDRLKNELTNPCAHQIFTELENGIYMDDVLSPEISLTIDDPIGQNVDLNFSESILLMFNNSDIFDYTITNGTPANPDANASTVGLTTTINDTYLSTATELSIARTMIHEMIHAYLNASYSNFIQFNSFTLRQKMEHYAAENGYTIGTNDFDHNFMGQYMNAMAYALYEWDKNYGTGGNLGWDYYYAMAFSGQFQVNPTTGNIASTTETFTELVPDSSERQDIVNIILNEQNNNSNAQGTDCN